MALAEPFAGGAGASLTLLYYEEVPEIVINDADTAIRDFWWAVANRGGEFVSLIQKTPVSVPEWKRQRAVYRSARTTRLRRGFAAFYLNRCNRSGIVMNGGPIGGIKQTGRWKLSARFNKQELVRRCAKVAEYRARITVSGRDGLDLLATCNPAETMFFIDPPYFHKGQTVYLNALDDGYHQALANRLRSIQHHAWVVTYDDCPEIRRLYSGWAVIRPFSLQYTASHRRAGREVLIAPKWMRLPIAQQSAAVRW